MFFLYRELHKKIFGHIAIWYRWEEHLFLFIGMESQVSVSIIQPPECFSAKNGKTLQSSLQSSDLLFVWLLIPLPTMLV